MVIELKNLDLAPGAFIHRGILVAPYYKLQSLLIISGLTTAVSFGN